MHILKYIKCGLRYIYDKNYRFSINTSLGLYNHLSDEMYLKRIFKARMGTDLDLTSPSTFNEKLQWLKLHDRNPIYTVMSDKYKAREYIANTIGEQYLIPLLGVWDNPDDINFDALPNQFVLKCNHNSGQGMCICTDKTTLNKATVAKNLRRGMKQDYYKCWREWPYKDIPRKIVAEKYMVNGSDKALNDYKFMCFNGKVICSFVCTDRFSNDGLKVTFFDRDWNRLPFERHYPSSKENITKPKTYDEMIVCAEKLSQGIPFVRVDLYEINGKVYFGELSFYPGAGLEEFTPSEWDYKLGNYINTDALRTGLEKNYE